jgi:hypothetical protein
MGMRQMTFEIPEEVAERFNSVVPESEQSAEVTKLLLRRASRRTLTEEQWAKACEAANADDELNALMDDWQAAGDPIKEPWDEPAPR